MTILTYLALVMLGFALGYIACGLVRSMYVPPMLPCDDDEDEDESEWTLTPEDEEFLLRWGNGR